MDTESLKWILGIGFGSLGSLMLYLNSAMSTKIDKLDEKLTDVDRRLCRIEGAMMNKDCCILKHDSNEKAE